MTELQNAETKPSSRGKTAIGRLFVLELSADRIHSMNTDGSDKKTIVTGCHLPAALRWMSQPATSTGPTWVVPAPTMAPSSAPFWFRRRECAADRILTLLGTNPSRRAGPMAGGRRRPCEGQGHNAVGRLWAQRRNARGTRLVAPKPRCAFLAEPFASARSPSWPCRWRA
jgi:hypothetical protein